MKSLMNVKFKRNESRKMLCILNVRWNKTGFALSPLNHICILARA